MFSFVISLLLITGAHTYQYDSHFTNQAASAASLGQIKFAIENHYDQTGPGAKKPDYAYHTYKNLDDALVAYMEDPDTKLPPFERARALARLYELEILKNQNDQHVRPINMYTGMQQKTVPLVLKRYKIYDNPKSAILPVVDLSALNANDAGSVNTLSDLVPFKWQKEQAPKTLPLTINVYNKDGGDYKPSAEYFFGFDEDRWQKQHSSPSSSVYTYTDSNGKTRTVYKHNNERPGFHSSIRQIFAN